MKVGIRELKNNLSRYLSQVDEGDEIIVTDRGRAVARISPVGTERTLERLISEGMVTRAKVSKGPAPEKRIRAKEAVSPLVDEQRR